MYDPARDRYTASDESLAHNATKHSTQDASQLSSQDKSVAGQDSQEREAKEHPPVHSDTCRFQPLWRIALTSVDAKGALPSPRSSTTAANNFQNPTIALQDNSPLDPMEPSKKDNSALPSEDVPIHQASTSPSRPEAPSSLTAKSANQTQTEKSPTGGTHSDKKRKLPAVDQPTENPTIDKDQPRSKRKRVQERVQRNRKRGKTPPSAYSRRDDALSQLPRSPSPIRSPSPAAPVRQRKRPGGGARVNAANVEALRRKQEERERQRQEEAQRELRDRGVHDVVRQHYNAVPERGREWRKTDSKIKGLRSFNNWVKSTIIQKFSPDEEFLASNTGNGWTAGSGEEEKRLIVLDVGCGKGGDLGKWQQAPQPIELYVGLDPAEVSINQARDRYNGMRNDRRRRRGHPLYHAEFHPKDCFGEWLGDLSIIQRVGIDGNIGPNGSLMSSRWGGGGFDIVASMFTMHYAFESEEKARQMLQNVAGALKKGGRFLGVGPNSDVLSAKVAEFHKKRKETLAATGTEDTNGKQEGKDADDALEWGNSIYRVRFPGETPEDGVFRPAFGWKYSYFMEEAVEEVPEYVVPWEAFRA
ncbi:conserved hypothetical protein [Uncinocarpus reesii 1704]|uniref:mRNA cap guanine-N(7) methyltransferase n=1 Tax=Uncinocarpus reesii (strain UAMH 1704) TaxID=336963 RepID=C4JGV5_UNCRE|nr:uncharacterized protein UREG_01206 [Uncinocarpus reesii 1704]EEP76357.1 conserved hypothetical protein [Uncinocarpus reesii 1704]